MESNIYNFFFFYIVKETIVDICIIADSTISFDFSATTFFVRKNDFVISIYTFNTDFVRS